MVAKKKAMATRKRPPLEDKPIEMSNINVHRIMRRLDALGVEMEALNALPDLIQARLDNLGTEINSLRETLELAIKETGEDNAGSE